MSSMSPLAAQSPSRPHAVVIGGGPAGLMAAETLTSRGVAVDLYDAMPSVGRKFLLAGKGGLNLTHAETPDRFVGRYGTRSAVMAPMLAAFDAQALRAWSQALGIETFIGSSDRVFPVGMKSAPLLRAWVHRLRERGVRLHTRHRWLGWENTVSGASSSVRHTLNFATPAGQITVSAALVVLALGGGSWARLGSDGTWARTLAAAGVEVAPLRPSNCGFEHAWSSHFKAHYAGSPLKSIHARFTDLNGANHERAGEILVTGSGLEGSLIYAWSAMLRDAIDATGSATIEIDLAPGRSLQRLTEEIAYPRGSRSWSSHLQSRAGIHGIKAALLRECLGAQAYHTPSSLVPAIKALALTLTGIRPLDEAISSAGGVCFEALDDRLMTHALPGVFCCGEMLDWEAPTGGYLLTGCFASGRAAGEGAARWLAMQSG